MKYEINASTMVIIPLVHVALINRIIFILDWDGNHRHGKSRQILSEFNLQDSKIKLKKRGLVHQENELWSAEMQSWSFEEKDES